MNIQVIAAIGVVALMANTTVYAAVTADEAKRLGTTLTPWGAEAGANADGSIPAYSGGLAAMKSLPVSDPAKGNYPDPFASEKPIFTITAKNLARYQDAVTPGMKALLQRFPDYYMNVYPTHRTASYPQWVIRNTLKNALSAHLTGAVEGDGVQGAYGGIPFPIPKSGAEVIWNHYLRWGGAYQFHRSQCFLVDAAGGLTNLGTANIQYAAPYYDRSRTTPFDGKFYRILKSIQESPVTVAGTAYLVEYPINYSLLDQVSWFYSPGQRRVRRAPEFEYDTPIASYGGAANFDEIDGFIGRLDRFDWKILGKKEMYLEYNDYKITGAYTERSDLEKPHFENPAYERWERHRVWVVDGTLKPGVRHAASRRTFYFDEDTWALLAAETYDQAGNLWRVNNNARVLVYPDPITEASFESVTYDFSKGNYLTVFAHAEDGDRLGAAEASPNMSEFTPEALVGMGVQ